MRLKGQQREQICEVLMSAFPDWGKLAQLISFELEERPADFQSPGGLSDTVFNLVQWAEAQGRIPQLVGAARRRNPGNEALRKVARWIFPDCKLNLRIDDHARTLFEEKVPLKGVVQALTFSELIDREGPTLEMELEALALDGDLPVAPIQSKCVAYVDGDRQEVLRVQTNHRDAVAYRLPPSEQLLRVRLLLCFAQEVTQVEIRCKDVLERFIQGVWRG